MQQTLRKLLIKDQIRRDLMAKPGHLSLRIAPRRALRGGDRLPERDFAAQMAHQLGQPDGLHRRQTGIEAAIRKRRGLGERTPLDHCGKACIAGGVEPVARRHQQNRCKAVSRLHMALAAPRADGDPGSAHHLIGAHQALGICGVKPVGGIGVEPRQLLAKRRPAQRVVER